MPCLYHQFLLNKLLGTTNISKNYTAVQLFQPYGWNNCLSKEEKETDNLLLFKKRAKEKIMGLRTAAIFFSKKTLTFKTICMNKVKCF